jgi:hypothetical protein
MTETNPEIELRLAIMEAKTWRDVGIAMLTAVLTGTSVAFVLDPEAALGNLLAGGILLWLLGAGLVGFFLLRALCIHKSRRALMGLQAHKQAILTPRL